jgi:uncharacterized C2H2 Zn-finger protein
MSDDRTTIQVSVDLWRWLNRRKRPGESFDDVLRRELDVDATAIDGGAGEATGDAGDAEGASDRRGQRTWYRCGYCGTVFEVAGALAAHVEENHSEATIHAGLDVDHDVIVPDDADDAHRCPDCDLSFEDWEEFVAHNEREHGRATA